MGCGLKIIRSNFNHKMSFKLFSFDTCKRKCKKNNSDVREIFVRVCVRLLRDLKIA